MRHLSDNNFNRVAPVAVALALLLGAPAAAAASCEAPPGTSGIDQYCEQVPGPGGDRGPDLGSGSPGGRAPGVSHRTGRALEAAGADGAGVLRLSRYGSAPAHADKGSRARRRAAPTDRPSSNPFAALGSSIKAGAKAGGVLLWVLLAVTLALFAAAWVEYRRRAHSDAG